MEEEIKTLGLYTFSALLQADAAIFGLYAIFLIYRLQLIENNFRMAIELVYAHGDNAKQQVSLLLRPTLPHELHGILLDAHNTQYLRQLLVVARTKSWREGLKLSAISTFLALTAHVAFVCLFLYGFNEARSVACLSPRLRIIACLVGFVAVLVTVLIANFRTLTDFTSEPPSSPPVLALKGLREEQLPLLTGISHVYSRRDSQGQRLIRIRASGVRKEGKMTYHLAFLTKTSSGELYKGVSLDDIIFEVLQIKLRESEESPEGFWKPAPNQ